MQITRGLVPVNATYLPYVGPSCLRSGRLQAHSAAVAWRGEISKDLISATQDDPAAAHQSYKLRKSCARQQPVGRKID